MRRVVERVLSGQDGALIERDVSEDPELERYRLEIPVLLLGAQEVARHRVTEAALRERLVRAGFDSGNAGSSGTPR
jgi:hypothetical protein